MDEKIIDGKAYAIQLEKELLKKIKKLKVQPRAVSLLIGDDPASLKYSLTKQRKAADLGIVFDIENISTNTSFEEIKKKINYLNDDSSIHGVMVQLPIPDVVLNGHSYEELLNTISPVKDIDGLTEQGQNYFLSATVKGVFDLMQYYAIDFDKYEPPAVVGSEGRVGKEIVKVLEKISYHPVIKVDKKLPKTNLKDLKKAVIIISVTGQPNLIQPDHLSKYAVVIDVGLGDLDPRCYDKVYAYTPPVGGIGPMTVISLMANIITAVENQKNSAVK